MARWEGYDVRVELPRVTEVHVRMVGGEVAVTAGAGPARIEAEVMHGDPVRVELEGGVLTVTHDPERLISAFQLGPFTFGGGKDKATRHEAVLSLAIPAEAPVTIRTVSADAIVAGGRAGASVTSVSGRVTVTDVAGDVGLRTVSGDVEADAVEGSVSTNTVSGRVTLAGDVSELTARSVSGDLTFDLDRGADVSLTSVSGSAVVRLPTDASLRLDLTTMSGHLDTAFHVVDGTSSRRRLTGDAGAEGGDARSTVTIRTLSGDVAVLRRERATASASATPEADDR